MTSQHLPGECNRCHAHLSRSAVGPHLRGCPRAKGHVPGFVVGIEALDNPLYWLVLGVGKNAQLADIDRFLRDTWLECCGHMSSFRTSDTSYDAAPELDLGPVDDVLPTSRSLKTPVAVALPLGSRADYVYDEGSPTELVIHVGRTRPLLGGARGVRLLAFNLPPRHHCHRCIRPAEVVCTWCTDEQRFLCGRHAGAHACGAEGFLPVVNSPRVGVCGFAGPPGRKPRWTRGSSGA